MKRDEKLLYNFVPVKNDKSSSSDVPPKKKKIKGLIKKIPKTKPTPFVCFHSFEIFFLIKKNTGIFFKVVYMVI